MKKSEKEVVVEKEVEKDSEGEKSENNGDEKVRGYTLDQFIGKNSSFRRTKEEIMNEPILELHDYINQP